ncbi:hypothetical protein [Pantoea stewartii]|uniref:Uncharacterized protein n=1 Tax=Pantoea stewartii subsp. stewartii DC283 TaxID=660596 RepID=H3R908_PANSE|nr:hypothetical protein [Pantoea stewartii]ARF51134.1 hypothetical protein DSJ_18635 [Pantoea stewartii subsp. stewartii DC283]EHU01671.1 hypothetical protein CKS_0106 [Pantoea stewartii subsp. stewartii DC283]KAB0558954.1 hypothetical protein F7Q90_03355 [Pantoea stewartii subsp. stewartii]
MKFDFRDNGATATLTITSSLFEYRRHQRAVDAALLSADVRASTSGIFIRKTVICGPVNRSLRAYEAAARESAND